MINIKRILTIIISLSILLQCAGVSAASKLKQKSKKTIKKTTQKKQLKLKNKSEQKPAPFNYPAIPDTSSLKEDRIGLSVGIKAGASAGLTGAVGELSYSLDKLVSGASVRGSVGYLTGVANATSTDNLKMATVNLDAIYSLSTNTPFNVYVGGGFIYPLKVNRSRSAGAWGAHAYLGSKYALQDNTSIYGELAYTGIKYQSDLAALRGVEAMMGYSYSF